MGYAKRDGLVSRRHTDSVEVRLKKANEGLYESKAEHRFVNLGVDIFPIQKDMVEIFYASDRPFKRGMKKRHKKALKKHEAAERRLAAELKSKADGKDNIPSASETI